MRVIFATLAFCVGACTPAAPPPAAPSSPSSAPVAAASMPPAAHLSPCGAASTSVPPSPVAQLAAGERTTCARLEDGSVWCWGARGSTLVDNDVVDGRVCTVATPVPSLAGAVDIRARIRAVCAARADAPAACIDLLYPDVPQPVPEGTLRRVAWWNEDLCGLTRDGAVHCVDRAGHRVPAPAAPGAEEIAPAGDRLCTLTGHQVPCVRRNGAAVTLSESAASVIDDGARLWIVSTRGELSRWSRAWDERMTQDYLDAPASVSQVATSSNRACALTRGPNAKLVCWSLDDHQTEIAVAGATKLAVGVTHTCIVRANGEVACWGSNACGEAGAQDETRPRRDGCHFHPEVPTPRTISWAAR